MCRCLKIIHSAPIEVEPLNCWYLDDGALAEPIDAALSILQANSNTSGLHINLSKCQLFSHQELSMFPSDIPCSACPQFELLGDPIGSAEYCAQYIESKRKDAFLLLSLLPQLSNPQVAVTILRSRASQHLLHQCQIWQCLVNSTMMFFIALNYLQQLN